MGAERIMEELKKVSNDNDQIYKMLVDLYHIQRTNTGRWKEQYKEVIKKYSAEVMLDD